MEDLTGTFDVFHNVENDILAFILAGFILVLALIYMFKAEIKDWIKAKRRAKKKISALKYHGVFNTVKKVVRDVEKMQLKTKSKGITYDDCIKTKIMHVLIQRKCEQIDKSLMTFLHRDDIESYSGAQMLREVENLLVDIVTEYNKDAINELVGIGIKRSDVVFAVEKYETFREYQVTAFLGNITDIISNPDYFTNYEKMSVIMECVSMSLRVIPHDLEIVFEQINGRFLKYDVKDVNL